MGPEEGSATQSREGAVESHGREGRGLTGLRFRKQEMHPSEERQPETSQGEGAEEGKTSRNLSHTEQTPYSRVKPNAGQGIHGPYSQEGTRDPRNQRQKQEQGWCESQGISCPSELPGNPLTHSLNCTY